MRKTRKSFFAAIMLMAMLVTVFSPIGAQAASKKLIYGIYKGKGISVQIGIDKRSKKLVMNYKSSDLDINGVEETIFHLKKTNKGFYMAKEWGTKKWYPDGYLSVHVKGKKIIVVRNYGHDDYPVTLKLKKKKKYVVK